MAEYVNLGISPGEAAFKMRQKVADNDQRIKAGLPPIHDLTGTGYMNPQASSFDLASLMKQFAPQKPAPNPYEGKLNALLADPGKFSSSPVFQYQADKGLEAASRGIAAKGMLNSGNRLLEMQKEGQGLASQSFFKLADLLGNLSTNKTNSTLAQDNANSSNALNWARLFQNQNQFNQLHGGSNGSRGISEPLNFY